jgi:hypothetical protein
MQTLPSEDVPSDAVFESAPVSEEHYSWVFVSHSAADYPAVQAIFRYFEGPPRFLTFHIANRAQGEEIARAYRPRILQSLGRCAWFVVIVSTASIQSKWVQFEVAWAVRNKPMNRLICLMLDDSDESTLHSDLSTAHKINVRPLIRPGQGLAAWFARIRVGRALPRSTFDRWTSDGGLGRL